jgi:hypothetical protein
MPRRSPPSYLRDTCVRLRTPVCDSRTSETSARGGLSPTSDWGDATVAVKAGLPPSPAVWLPRLHRVGLGIGHGTWPWREQPWELHGGSPIISRLRSVASTPDRPPDGGVAGGRRVGRFQRPSRVGGGRVVVAGRVLDPLASSTSGVRAERRARTSELVAVEPRLRRAAHRLDRYPLACLLGS